ncbi:hypothetical protein HF283_17170 [Acidithiobacillus ferrooxidans]|nr:hypothetical protein [Acidithiobacillus ferrooxidans]
MRKISLALLVLVGLSGVAYGANWVEIGHTSASRLWVAPAQPRDCVWEKMLFTAPQQALGRPYNKIVSLVKVNCAQGWIKELQDSIYMDNQLVGNASLHEGRFYAAPGTAASVLVNAVCRK